MKALTRPWASSAAPKRRARSRFGVLWECTGDSQVAACLRDYAYGEGVFPTSRRLGHNKEWEVEFCFCKHVKDCSQILSEIHINYLMSHITRRFHLVNSKFLY